MFTIYTTRFFYANYFKIHFIVNALYIRRESVAGPVPAYFWLHLKHPINVLAFITAVLRCLEAMK
jgi:hypothetical protein